MADVWKDFQAVVLVQILILVVGLARGQPPPQQQPQQLGQQPARMGPMGQQGLAQQQSLQPRPAGVMGGMPGSAPSAGQNPGMINTAGYPPGRVLPPGALPGNNPAGQQFQPRPDTAAPNSAYPGGLDNSRFGGQPHPADQDQQQVRQPFGPQHPGFLPRTHSPGGGGANNDTNKENGSSVFTTGLRRDETNSARENLMRFDFALLICSVAFIAKGYV